MAFYCCGRLGTKPVLSTISKFPTVLSAAQYAQAAAGVPKITYKKFEPPKPEHHDIRNERLQRPLSPHLTIYAPQLTSMLSITHRAAGMILSGYVSALGIGALILPNDISHYITMIEGLHLSPATLLLAKAAIAAPLGYHFVNGIRHLYWDTAKGLTLKEVYSTGYAMLAASAVVTLILAAL
ncbi:succinate dehydrogenase cytochrome b560 subunit, mitochondrial-like [Galleria mellonella]|uniref:Succinate dehydrogenase cytochrome b560 subunit, mitochondrial-like n=1 Tax=Galleria mellonella TaxID=7137 RepID=A0A6J1W820_GALME|nr:succinate dehydrogenase cytochrome b560 subunit, mitochondrial-like [Galleria mellonella]XP_031766778.1 succinate dehydrogenase cytochrome b560 subunit, mitochondrial-like [Galleria mellonella]